MENNVPLRHLLTVPEGRSARVPRAPPLFTPYTSVFHPVIVIVIVILVLVLVLVVDVVIEVYTWWTNRQTERERERERERDRSISSLVCVNSVPKRAERMAGQ